MFAWSSFRRSQRWTRRLSTSEPLASSGSEVLFDVVPVVWIVRGRRYGLVGCGTRPSSCFGHGPFRWVNPFLNNRCGSVGISRHVVQAASPTVHRARPRRTDPVGERRARELAPWSVLKMPGVPVANAASSASTQQAALHRVRQPPRQYVPASVLPLKTVEHSRGRHRLCQQEAIHAQGTPPGTGHLDGGRTASLDLAGPSIAHGPAACAPRPHHPGLRRRPGHARHRQAPASVRDHRLQVAHPISRRPDRRLDRRTPAGRPAPHHRRAGRGRGGAHPGIDPARRHPLEHAGHGRGLPA